MVHCSATRSNMDWGRADIDRSHRQRGFTMIGYHYVIKRDGTLEVGRPENAVGAHAVEVNKTSVGVCMVGGLGANGRGEDNFTPAQYDRLAKVLRDLKTRYPRAGICGHRDLSPDKNGDGKITSNEWMKECPSFDVAAFVKARGI